MFARTERLFLRPLWPEDAATLAKGVGNPVVARMLARVPHPYARADADGYIAGEWAKPPHQVSCAIFRRTDAGPAHVGGIGVGPGPHGLYEEDVELGYWLAEPWWGQGIAVEAGRAMLEIAFLALGHASVNSAHFLDNPRSGSVLRRLGFRDTGRVRPHPCLARGEDVQCAEYVLTRECWLASNPARRSAA